MSMRKLFCRVYIHLYMFDDRKPSFSPSWAVSYFMSRKRRIMMMSETIFLWPDPVSEIVEISAQTWCKSILYDRSTNRFHSYNTFFWSVFYDLPLFFPFFSFHRIKSSLYYRWYIRHVFGRIHALSWARNGKQECSYEYGGVWRSV